MAPQATNIVKSGPPVERTPGGILVRTEVAPRPAGALATTDAAGLALRVEYERLKLLRGFDDLLCLDGLVGVEHLPHQIETVRRVLRHFRSRALLADEVGLGKTIEAAMLVREYLLRGLARRVLILVPAPLVSQWREELHAKFGLEFTTPDRAKTDGAEFWNKTELVLSSISHAKSARHFADVTAPAWDLVVIDEAHHCKNRATLNWKLVNALKRRALFMLTATPVQNNLLEIYNLLTLLEPGHLKTERDFKANFVTRGNPRDPRNRERLRGLLREVMIRNTRSLVHMNLPPRYSQTFIVQPAEGERKLYRELESYLRARLPKSEPAEANEKEDGEAKEALEEAEGLTQSTEPPPAAEDGQKPLNRMQLNFFLLAAGSAPATLAARLEPRAAHDPEARRLLDMARRTTTSAKEAKLLELLRLNPGTKTLVFASFRATLDRLAKVLRAAGIGFTTYSGEETAAQKDRAVEEFRERVPVMLCSESGGEGRNLQFANTLINYDLPWNPMRIEQRIGRIHRIGQTREVFIFNLAAAGSLEERILRLLSDKIRMFELVVGEIGSILGNLEGGDEFESLVLELWLRSRSADELDRAFEALGEALLEAQTQYVKAKELDEALFGEDYE